MRIVAVLVPDATRRELTESAWASLIQTHAKLASPGVRRRTSPFTQQPIELPPRRDLGLVVKGGKRIGLIEWAQDGSNVLLVRQEDNDDASRAALLEVAWDIALCLGVNCDIQHDLVSRDDDPVPPSEDPLVKAVRLWKTGDGEGAIAHYMSSFDVDLRTAMRALADFAAKGSRSGGNAG